jgi:hypothetical protein
VAIENAHLHSKERLASMNAAGVEFPEEKAA